MIINPISISRILVVTALSMSLTQPVTAGGPKECSNSPVSLKIEKAGYTQNGSLLNPTLMLEAKSSAPFPDDERVLMLRIYRQSEQAPLKKQDVYLTGAAEGINRSMHSSATWQDEVTLTPTVGGNLHYYTFSLVTNRNEYFSNTVESDIPDIYETQAKADSETHTLPVIFHLFEHPGLPQMPFDAESAREWVDAANAVLGNAAATSGLVDAHVRLTLVENAPDGKPLTEPGIHRSSDSPTLCLDGRADMLDLEHPDIYWDQNSYLNVVVLPFAMTDNNVLGQYPQFPEGSVLTGCRTSGHPTAPHAIYINSLVEPIHGIPFFLTGLGYYFGLTEEQCGGVYGLNPLRNTLLGCSPQLAERVDYTLKHAWNTVKSTK